MNCCETSLEQWMVVLAVFDWVSLVFYGKRVNLALAPFSGSTRLDLTLKFFKISGKV